MLFMLWQTKFRSGETKPTPYCKIFEHFGYIPIINQVVYDCHFSTFFLQTRKSSFDYKWPLQSNLVSLKRSVTGGSDLWITWNCRPAEKSDISLLHLLHLLLSKKCQSHNNDPYACISKCVIIMLPMHKTSYLDWLVPIFCLLSNRYNGYYIS